MWEIVSSIDPLGYEEGLKVKEWTVQWRHFIPVC